MPLFTLDSSIGEGPLVAASVHVGQFRYELRPTQPDGRSVSVTDEAVCAAIRETGQWVETAGSGEPATAIAATPPPLAAPADSQAPVDVGPVSVGVAPEAPAPVPVDPAPIVSTPDPVPAVPGEETNQ